jgi:hypothetical protein
MITDRSELPIDVPFSLSCCECDCDSPDTLEDALASGWTSIQYTPDGLAENFLGYCPEHSRLLNMTPAQIAAENRLREGAD